MEKKLCSFNEVDTGWAKVVETARATFVIEKEDDDYYYIISIRFKRFNISNHQCYDFDTEEERGDFFDMIDQMFCDDLYYHVFNEN